MIEQHDLSLLNVQKGDIHIPTFLATFDNYINEFRKQLDKDADYINKLHQEGKTNSSRFRILEHKYITANTVQDYSEMCVFTIRNLMLRCKSYEEQRYDLVNYANREINQLRNENKFLKRILKTHDIQY